MLQEMFYFAEKLFFCSKKIKPKYSTLKRLKIENYELQRDILYKSNRVNNIVFIIMKPQL